MIKRTKQRLKVPTEHIEQKRLMEWWKLAHRGFEVKENMFFAIPNGGDRHAAVGAKLKAEGVRAGIPDMMLAVPRGGHHGLFIELKRRRGGKVSDAQSTIMEGLAAHGYRCEVCKGWGEAKDKIEEYLR